MIRSNNSHYPVDIIQNGAELGNVPALAGGVGDGAADVGPVERGDEGNVLPVRSLQLLVITVLWWLVTKIYIS